jgi:hypothetical protein
LTRGRMTGNARRMLRSRFVLALLGMAALGVGVPLQGRADEGQWTPDQIAALDQAALARMGLALAPADLWNPDGDEKTGGLMRAAVNYSGCSAAFVSAEGLIATNHHCAYRALQSQSSVEHDYTTNGFLARTRAEELEAKGGTVRILRRVTDVSAEIQAAAGQAPAGAKGDAARWRAIQRAQKELVAACEKTPDARCDVASFYGGSQYRLSEYVELRDVRLVYAPPAAVGEYGGEIDNWMWPRHTGDFALLRAYVTPDGAPADHAAENVPYRPAQYLKVSGAGVAPDSFVAVLGYPGRTRRYMPAAEVARWIDQVLPGQVELFGEWLEILDGLGAADEAVRIKVAALAKSLANRHKNARGMLDGIAHMKLGEVRKAEDAALRAWVAMPENASKGYAGVLDELDALSAAARASHDRTALLEMLARGPNLLALGIDLVRAEREQARPDLERAQRYMARNRTQVWKDIERNLRDFDARVDAALLASLVARNASLPRAQRIAAFTKLAGGRAGKRDAFVAVTAPLLASTVLADAALVAELWQDPAKLAAQRDPLLALARALAGELEALERAQEAYEGALARVQPRYFEMLRAMRPGPIYPDANGTLRFSYATVKGYEKWDGAPQAPQTTLAGAVAKHTGEEPFDLPDEIRQRADAARQSRWADAALGDLPLCFLATGDTTGGNSGSPVIDGKGRLVGLNFDRVWENIAGDFAYHPGHSRNIVVDARFLLWMLDEVAGAEALLAELAPELPAPAAAAQPAGQAGPAAGADASKARSGCGCHAGGRAIETGETGGPGAGGLVVLLALLAGLALLRRRALT